MIYQGLEFHNVDHLEQVSGMAGLRLERFPQELGRALGIPGNHKARFRSKRVHGCEVRFVTEAKAFDVCLTAVESDIDVVIYRGDLLHEKRTLKAGVCTVLHVEYPEMYGQVETEQLPRKRFASSVWRIQCGMNGYLYFHYLDTYGFERRPPEMEEKPQVLWAAYGSSITCGSKTTTYSNSYIEQAAWRLGYDVMNKGLSGTCMCEPEMAKYLAGLPVDVLSLEMGVNMMLPFDEESFENQVRRFLEIVKQGSQAREIYLIDIFTNRAPILKDHGNHYYRHYENFKAIVKRLSHEMGDSRMKWIDGSWIAKDMTYLTTDLLHPSDYGHICMGENLAQAMKGVE